MNMVIVIAPLLFLDFELSNIMYHFCFMLFGFFFLIMFLLVFLAFILMFTMMLVLVGLVLLFFFVWHGCVL